MGDLNVMPTLRQVDIAITGRCNLACKYCFYADEMVARDDLPTERWLSFFDELRRLGVMMVCLTGGEAFTRRDLFELIDGIIANRMRYQILSNGTLITEQVLAQFEVGKRRKRLDSIQVSVDGSRAEIHDLSRPNSFDRVIRALRLLKDTGFPIAVRVTVNRYNVDDLENIARLLLDEIGLPNFSTNEAYPCGATNRAEGGIMMTPAQRLLAMRTLTDLAARYDGRINAQAGPLALARQFQMIEDALAAGQTEMPGRGTLCGCGGVFNAIAVLHDGTIVPCHNLSTLRLGVVGKDDLQNAWREQTLMNAVRARRTIPLQSLETCRNCRYQGFCTGSCPGGAIYLTGELNARNPMDCYRIHQRQDQSFALDFDATSAHD
jgi:SynChlorMet cassette radical SAM/SPASM protein ScmE